MIENSIVAFVTNFENLISNFLSNISNIFNSFDFYSNLFDFFFGICLILFWICLILFDFFSNLFDSIANSFDFIQYFTNLNIIKNSKTTKYNLQTNLISIILIQNMIVNLIFSIVEYFEYFSNDLQIFEFVKIKLQNCFEFH